MLGLAHSPSHPTHLGRRGFHCGHSCGSFFMDNTSPRPYKGSIMRLAYPLGIKFQRRLWAALALSLLALQTVLLLITSSTSLGISISNSINAVLLVLAASVATANAVNNRESIRLFWSFLALAYGLWALHMVGFIFDVVISGKGRPDFLVASTLLLLRTGGIIAAVASRPHLRLSTQRPYQTTLDFLTLLFFLVFAYAYLLIPYNYASRASIMILRYEALSLAENLLLLLVLVTLISRAPPPWKTIYWLLFGASTLYVFSGLAYNLRFALKGTLGGLYEVPCTVAVFWLVWVSLRGRELAPELAQTVQADRTDTRRFRGLAMLAVLVIPLVGVFELFRGSEPNETRVTRLVVVLITVLMLALMAFVRDILTNRELTSDLIAVNNRFRLAVEAGRMYAFEWDADTDVIVRSGECAAILNWMDNPTRDTGRQFSTCVHPDDREAYTNPETVLTPGNPTYQTSYRVLCPDGGVIWLEARGYAEFNHKGKMLRIIGMVVDVTERRRAERELLELSGRLMRAQEDERTRIARELHDDLNQRMALLQIHLEHLGQDKRVSSETRQQLHNIRNSCDEVSSNLRNLSHQLHPYKLDLLGLAAALGSFCEEFSRQHNLQIQFIHQDVPNQIPKDVALSLFRIVQEALRNVVKHSGAAEARVELIHHDGQIELCISDSGVGFRPDNVTAEAGLGLISMRERLRLVRGHLYVQSEPSRGTRIRARVPLFGTKSEATGEGRAHSAET
jgi:signal transduction histidine kinase